MRPTRLELEGFGSFRERTEIALDDVDLFVLTGATGSGKTTLLDAIVFCLYGSVPRYDDRRLVAPVISQGLNQARVRLDFTVGGVPFTATRVVRRSGAGASTKEARLEDGVGTALAGNERELTAAVEARLGLTFEHFTRCVVLPQGDFQELLHATPKERYDLLVRLLDLDVYRRIATRSRDRATQAATRIQVADQRLERDLAGATEDARKEAAARLEQLESLQAELTDARAELEEVARRGEEARRAATEASERADALTAVTVPDGIAELAQRLDAAATVVAQAEQRAADAATAREQAGAARDRLPDPAPLRSSLDALERRARLAADLDTARGDLETAERAVRTAATTADDARAALDRARQRVDEVRHQHAAHTLAEQLAPGDPCPVCDRTVEVVPDHPTPAGLDDARTALQEADATARRAEDGRRTAEAGRAAAEQRVTLLREQQGQLDDELTALAVHVGQLDGRDLEGRLTAVSAAEQAHRAAASAEQAARRELEGAIRDRDALTTERDAAWTTFDGTRDRVAALGPPPTDRDDLQAAWSALASWARAQVAAHRGAAEEAQRQATALAERYRRRTQDLIGACTAAGIEVPDGTHPLDACVQARADARSALERIERDLEEAARVEAERRDAVHRHRVARDLGRHLDARNFERWLLDRALARLVEGAAGILRDLTQGSFGLDLGEGSAFLVVDHRNADERRPVRTLSGGETFLASLALALSLAEHVADLAARGAARLESLFIDEGFGTLDADALETVAVAIEELGSRGRLVGLVTHIRELAERLPVRLEVRKVAGTSTVEKVVA